MTAFGQNKHALPFHLPEQAPALLLPFLVFFLWLLLRTHKGFSFIFLSIRVTVMKGALGTLSLNFGK